MIADFNRLGNAITKFSGVDFGLIGSYDKTMQASIYSILGTSVQGLNDKELMLLATKYNLNEETMRQILLTSGLEKEQVSAKLAALGYAGAEEALNAVSVQNIVMSQAKDRQQAKELLMNLGLIDSNGVLIGTTEGLTASKLMAAGATVKMSDEEIKELALKLKLIPTNMSLSSTYTGLTATIWSSVKAMGAFLVSNPIGWAVSAALAIAGTAKVIDWLTKSTAEAAEDLKKTAESFDETKSKLESLQKDLETTAERISDLQELSNSGKITLVEQTELDKLKTTNKELERNIALEKIRNKDAQNQLNKDSMKLYKTMYGTSSIPEYDNTGKRNWAEKALSFAPGGGVLDTSIDMAIESIKTLLGLQKSVDVSNISKAIPVSPAESFDEMLEKMRSLDEESEEYKKLLSEINPLIDNYSLIVENLVPSTQEEKNALADANFQLDKANYILGDNQDKVNIVVGAIEKYGAGTGELTKYLTSLGFSEDQIAEKLKAYKSGALKADEENKDLKTSTDDVTAAVKTLSDAFDGLPERMEDLEDIQKKVSEGYEFSYSEIEKIRKVYPELNDYITRTSIGWKIQSGAIDTLSTGVRFTAEEIAFLNEKYSNLNAKQVQVTDSSGNVTTAYYLEVDAIKATGKTALQLAIDVAQAQVDATRATITGTEQRVAALKIEAGALTELANAVSGFSDAMQQNAAYDVNADGRIDTIDYDLIKNADAAKEKIKSLQDAEKTLSDLQRRLSEISVGKVSGTSGQDKGKTEDKNKEAFDKAKADLDHKRAMNLISEKQYLDALEKLYKKHFSNRSKYLAEYNQYEEQVYEGRQQLLEEAKSALEDLHDLTMDMIKQEKEAEKEAWEEKKTALQEYVDARKEALEQEKEASDYAESLAKKQKKLNDLNLEMNSLMGDTSAEGQRRRIELAQEIADTQTELDDYVADHEYDAQMDAIDKEADAQISAYDEKIELIDEYLNNQNLLVQDAYDRMNGMSAQLKNDLIAYNKEFGTGMQQDVIDKWNDAYKAAKAYGDLMNMGGTVTTISSQIGKPPTTSGGSSGGSSSGGGSSGGGSGGGSSGGGNKPAVGSTVSVEASATNFGSKSGGVAMADFVSGGQFTVYQVSGGQVLIGRNGTYTGWVNLSDIVGYAKGTDYLPYTGFVKHGENGEEMVLGSAGDKYALLNRGSKIFTAAKTAKLDNFLSSPSDFILNSLNQKFSGRGGVLGSVTNNVSQMTNNIIFDIDGADATVVKDEIVRVIPELTRRICANLNKEIIQSGNKLNAKIMG